VIAQFDRLRHGITNFPQGVKHVRFVGVGLLKKAFPHQDFPIDIDEDTRLLFTARDVRGGQQ
jgi:hypothetical protein